MMPTLKIECKNCKRWNNIEVRNAMLEPDSAEPKVKVFLPSYIVEEPQACENCKIVLAEPNELFRIINGEAVRYEMKDIG